MQHAAWSSWNMETSKVQGLKAWIVEVYSVYLHPPSMFKLLAEIASQTSSFKPLILSKDVFAHALLQIFIQPKRSALCDLMNIAVSLAKIILAS